MKFLIAVTSALLVLSVSNAGAQTLSKGQVKKIADLVLKRDYNLIAQATYDKASGVWICSPTRGIVHGDMQIEIRDRDYFHRFSRPGIEPKKNPFRLDPSLKRAILEIASQEESG